MNIAERIYMASTSDGAAVAHQTETLARRIEDDIAQVGFVPGCSFGSLSELAGRYGAGRSVVREAVGILERRGLGRLRPGPHGGFILARPQVHTIGAALADHFLAMGVTSDQLEDAREATELVTPSAAATSMVPLLRECLRQVQGGLRAQRSGLRLADAADATTMGTRAMGIARSLAQEIHRLRATGTRLGSESDLCERFDVGRLTVRQAIRLLQDSGLVECRRGRGNGLVINDQRATGHIRLVLAYLIAEQMDPLQAGTILIQLNAYVPALAAHRANPAQRRELEALLAPLESGDSFKRLDLLALVRCVARLANSPLIDFFSRCLAAYEARFHPALAEHLPTTSQAEYFAMVRRQLQAAPPAASTHLAAAKRDSAACMMAMSVQRPF
jgi:DNA-binding FadR family transcriptional regulator